MCKGGYRCGGLIERGDIMTSVNVSVWVGVGDTMRRINRNGGYFEIVR